MLRGLQYRLSILKKLFPHAYRVKRFFVLLCITSLCSIILAMITPLFYKMLVDDVIINKNIDRLIMVVSGYLGIFIINLFVDMLSTYSSNRLINRVLFNIRMRIWNHYLGFSYEDHNQYNVGDLRIRIDEDVEKVSTFANMHTIDFVSSFAKILITGIVIFTLSWQLALFSILLVPFTFLLGRFVGKGERFLSEQSRLYCNQRDSWLHSSISGWKEVKALNLQKHEYRVFVRYLHKLALNNAKWINYWVMQALVIPIIKDKFIMKFSLYFIGGLLVMQGNYTIGILLVFIQYYEIFCNSINQINDSNVQLQSDMPSFDRLLEVISFTKSDSERKLRFKKLPGNIRFENVTFKYDLHLDYILKDICLDIRKGEKIAIVGKSGAGKTTMLKLLLDLIPCTEGRILVGGEDVRMLQSTILHRNVGVVMQDSVLFNVSIIDNLILVKPNATHDEIVEACQMANIKDFIESLPDKYDTIIGERGTKISGGQKQRIAIARVFLQRPEIIIFDESTSALDQESEALIHDSIKNFGRDKTVIIIAHRLSSVLISDRVIVLKDGVIAGMAHHKELLGNNDAYDELFRGQYIS